VRFLLAVAALGTSIALGAQAADVEELRSIGALPAHLAAAFTEVSACHTTASGQFLIFDRRSHAVATTTSASDGPRVIVHIGISPGEILQPSGFDSSPNGTFVVADAPSSQPRLQFFTETGAARGGFTLPRPDTPLFTLGDVVVSGVGSLRYTGQSVLLSQPENGALVGEYDLVGKAVRSFGDLRKTGQEHDRAVHIALNLGIVLPDPKGGFYFVFLSGIPMFRKYDSAGKLLFERHIEGVELDEYVRGLPTTWAPRRQSANEFPLVYPTVRTAAVDPDGLLWISLAVPYTYVYDGRGDKRRTIQFRGAGPISPTHIFFTTDKRILVTPGCYIFARQS
jgi:hypothetical protein